MAPSLLLQKSDFEAEVGNYLGFGRGAAAGDQAWDDYQAREIASVLASGLRQFYNPSTIPGVGFHDWTFLKPTCTVPIGAGLTSAPLPDDFGGIEGPVRLAGGSAALPVAIQQVNESFLATHALSSPAATGQPLYSAVRALKGTDATGPNRKELAVFPVTNAGYQLQFRYYLFPEALSAAYPYAYGGAPHAETIKAACLAAAELHLDGAQGDRWKFFAERLQASVNYDRKGEPQILGYNGDWSDRVVLPGRRPVWPSIVTVNGEVP